MLILIVIFLASSPAHSSLNYDGSEDVAQGLRTPQAEVPARLPQKSKPKKVSISGCKKEGLSYYYSNSSKSKNWKGRCQEQLSMNSRFRDFLNSNLLSCINQARGTTSSSARIVHAGVAGDSNHESTSWHSELLSIDVKGIIIDGKVLSYADKSQAVFFKGLRNCWARRVIKYSKTGKQCNETNEGYPAGSVGNEDSSHRHHLHLSLPCQKDRMRKSPSFDDMNWS